jgi:hypothetical protein
MNQRFLTNKHKTLKIQLIKAMKIIKTIILLAFATVCLSQNQSSKSKLSPPVGVTIDKTNLIAQSGYSFEYSKDKSSVYLIKDKIIINTIKCICDYEDIHQHYCYPSLKRYQGETVTCKTEPGCNNCRMEASGGIIISHEQFEKIIK